MIKNICIRVLDCLLTELNCVSSSLYRINTPIEETRETEFPDLDP